ncbi:MAG: DUF389 domain-containing protein [Bacteroidota bacterium]
MKKEILYIIALFRRLYVSILGIKEGTDTEAVIEGIKKDIGFRGHTAWILMFSIIIASIGLNINSTAVIIGAMLISPLMGPILGIGLAVGTNDLETLIRALKNLGIAVSLALITSTFYFLLSPLDVAQSELIARTRPTILDVMVALFGGFAGIVAGSRKEKSNVIPGVAIATALMPPLCTAGYGLATLQMDFFLGAFYLFFINSVFIALSTYLVVRYLRFPMLRTIEERKQKKYRRIFAIFLLVTIIPSGIIFYQVIQETRFKAAAENYISKATIFEGTELISYKTVYSDTLSRIDLYFIGKPVDREKAFYLTDRLSDFGLAGKKGFRITRKTEVVIHQEQSDPADLDQRFARMNADLRVGILEDLYTKNEQVIRDKDLRIKLLEDEVLYLRRQDTIPFRQIDREMKYQFSSVESYAFGRTIGIRQVSDSVVYDTIPTFILSFRNELGAAARRSEGQKVEAWLRVRLADERIRAITD